MVNGLTLAAAGFTVTAWAVFKEYSWWHTGALLSAIVGLVAEVAVGSCSAWVTGCRRPPPVIHYCSDHGFGSGGGRR